MSKKEKDKPQTLDDILSNADVKILDSGDVPSPTDSDKKRKKCFDENDILDISQEAIEELRKQTLDKLEEHVKAIKESINKDDLSSYMLENRIELLEKSKYMLNEFMVSILTQKISDARCFEVLSELMRTTAEINNSVVNINEDKAKLKDKERETELIKNTSELIGNIIKENLTTLNFKEKKTNNIKVIGA